MAKEILSYRLNTLHNLFYFTTLLEGLRDALRAGTFAEFRHNFYRNLADGDSDAQKRGYLF